MSSNLRRLLALDADESESGFSSVVYDLSRRGLFVAGSLGLTVTLFYVLAHLLLLGFEPAWSYTDADPNHLVMWDKLFMVGISVIGMLAARTSLAAENARSTLAVLILAAGIAMILDDLAGGHSSYSVGYLTVLIILAVGSVPFRPTQVLVLCLVILGLLIIGPLIASTLDWPERPVLVREIVYWIICTVLFVGIAALVYRSRFEQFMARRAVERADAEIKLQAERLAEMESLKSRFFAGISHEFRTPITLILGPARDTLEDDNNLSSKTRKSLELIERNGRRLGQLVEQLLDLSRLESGRLPLHVARYDTAQLVRRVASAFVTLATTRGIEFEVESTATDPVLFLDAEQIQKVIENLLSNAFKFTPDGGRIRVAVQNGRDSDSIMISVKDNGSGIPAGEIAHVFDRFHQVAVDKRGNAPGAGIGLALAKELVEIHGGQITATSESGFGSEFVVTLRRGSDHFDARDLMASTGDDSATQTIPEMTLKSPATELLTEGPTDDGSTTESEASRSSVGHPTVLIVEDHPDMRAYLTRLLEVDYSVLVAEDGRVGLEQAFEHVPDLIITDLMMPEVDGHELCLSVKRDERTAHIPVIMLTAKATRESRLEGLSEGADDYILKPFDAAELRARVENLIEIRRVLRRSPEPGFEVSPSEIDEPSADQQFMDQVSAVVESHMGDSNFTVEWLADEVGLSRRQLERRVREITRLTPGGFIRLMRLKRAGQLIQADVGTISEIAYRVGFNDPNYFSRLFRQTFGVPPSAYRRAE